MNKQNHPSVKILQINSLTWMWILYKGDGTEVLCSKEFKTKNDCRSNLDLVSFLFELDPNEEIIPLPSHPELDFPDFISHY